MPPDFAHTTGDPTKRVLLALAHVAEDDLVDPLDEQLGARASGLLRIRAFEKGQTLRKFNTSVPLERFGKNRTSGNGTRHG